MTRHNSADDDTHGLRTLCWGAGLVALPFIIFGICVLVDVPWPTISYEMQPAIMLGLLLAGGACLVSGAGFLVAFLILTISRDADKHR